jgi:hypothetical protein
MPNSIENDELHEEMMRVEGDSKDRAARMSNAAGVRGRASVRRNGYRSGSYDTWTVPELRKRAKELGLTGYSGLSKSDLIFELRAH